MATIKMYAGQPKTMEVRHFNLTNASTTATAVAKLPRGSLILGFLLNGVASDAGTTATVSIGKTTAANEFVNGADVKTAAAGVGPTLLPGVSGAFGTFPLVQTSGGTGYADTVVYAVYAETGTASTVGNWTIAILYTVGRTTR